MRLLDIKSCTLSEFHSSDVPPYLIASHRWFASEPTFKDVLKQRNQESRGFRKIKGFCNFAMNAAAQSTGVSHLWIDTCCIDKSSSAELTESVNSMMRFYRQSECCLVYLADVGPLRLGRAEVMDEFRNSEWFQRGWTLQELLAPDVVLFLNSEWDVIGYKGRLKGGSVARRLYGSGRIYDLAPAIEGMTGIPTKVLRDYTKSKKMGFEEKKMWAKDRQTTREEDLAYCLLGIFDVHMPLVYGEGMRAHDRLLREIAERNKPIQTKMERKRQRQAAYEEKQQRNLLYYESRATEIPIMPPRTGTEDPIVTELRDAGIVSLLWKNTVAFHGSKDLPVIVTARTMNRLGYVDPGEALHEALYNIERQSWLVREAISNGTEINRPQSRATEHMIEGLMLRGHSREMAVAILFIYLNYDPVVFAHIEFPYIEPVTSHPPGPVPDDPSIEEDIKQEQNKDGQRSLVDLAIGLSTDFSQTTRIVHNHNDVTATTGEPDGMKLNANTEWTSRETARGHKFARNPRNRIIDSSFDRFTQQHLFL